jgi:Mg-chelatase subunit ChlD
VPFIVGVLILGWIALRWMDSGPSGSPPGGPPGQPRGPYISEVDEGLGISVVIVLDNSGSMERAAAGDREEKFRVARRSIQEMLAVTDSFSALNPELPVKVGLFWFSGSVHRVLPIQPYDPVTVTEALDRIPFPNGATAIGTAMRAAREELYRSGTFRKHLVVITDGENTDGPSPAEVGRDIFRRSEGSVQLHFVAFDTDPEKFGFLDQVEGTLLAASNAVLLRAGLEELYRTGILAESMEGVEPSIY